MTGRSAFMVLPAVLLLGLTGPACNNFGGGAELQRQSFQFPVGLAVHSAGFALVVNSNFDLKYASGSLRIIDLNGLADAVDNGTAIDPDDPDRITNTQFILDEPDQSVGLKNFGGGIDLSETPEGGLAMLAVRENNYVVFVDVKIDDPQSDHPTISLDCGQGAERFAQCDGAKHMLNIDRDDPFEVLLFDGENTGSGADHSALVSFLRSGAIAAVQIPADPDDVPRLDYLLETGLAGVNDLAYSPAIGLVYSTNLAAISKSNPINYFDPSMGVDAEIRRLDLFSTLLGYETRGIDFTQDGMTAAVLVRSPNLLAFLDVSPGTGGLPRNNYLGQVVVGNSPSRVRSHGDLLLVTCAEDDSVYIIDANTMRLLELREDICRGPYDIDFFDKDPHHWALITCFEDDVVAVLDLNPASPDYLDVIARVGKPRD